MVSFRPSFARRPFAFASAFFAAVIPLAACTSAIEIRRTPADEGDGGLTEAPAEAVLTGADGGVATDSALPEEAATEASAFVSPDGGKAALCASEFGTTLTAPYGRLDGTVLAVLKPTDQQCPRPNGDHLILQVVSGGMPYRMVVNVLSTFSGVAPEVRLKRTPHALIGPAWSEGWHTDTALDYVTDLGVTNTEFTPFAMSDLSDRVTDAIALGDKVSVYASTSGGDSAHLIHRNKSKKDGAIVLHADGPSPEYLLFSFANQAF